MTSPIRPAHRTATTAADRRRAERKPGQKRQVVLVTPTGPLAGLLNDISSTGALVEADGRDLAGCHVALCIPGKRVWVRKGVVVWYSLLRGVSIEFDAEEDDTPPVPAELLRESAS